MVLIRLMLRMAAFLGVPFCYAARHRHGELTALTARTRGKNQCGIRMIKLAVTNERNQLSSVLIWDWSTIEILRKTNRDTGCSKVYTAFCATGDLVVTKTCDSSFHDARALKFVKTRSTDAGQREQIVVNEAVLHDDGFGRIKSARFALVEISGLANPLRHDFQGQGGQSLVTSGECGKPSVPTWVVVDPQALGVESRIVDVTVEEDQYTQCTSVGMKGTCSRWTQQEGFTEEERCIELARGFDIQMGLRTPREDGCTTTKRGPGILTCCRRCRCQQGRRSWPCSPI